MFPLESAISHVYMPCGVLMLTCNPVVLASYTSRYESVLPAKTLPLLYKTDDLASVVFERQ